MRIRNYCLPALCLLLVAALVQTPASEGRYIQRSDDYRMTVYSPIVERVCQISAGQTHSLAVTVDGKLFAWGNPANGRLGNNNTTGTYNRPVLIQVIVVVGTIPADPEDEGSEPQDITEIIKFKHVQAGSDFSVAIDTYGDIWAWGSNANGRTGLGTTTGNTTIPSKITSFDFNGGSNASTPKFVKLALTFDQVIALDEDGRIWTWGAGANGALGHGNTTQYTTPRLVNNSTISSVVFTDIEASSSASTNTRAVLALDDEGNIWGWGVNGLGMLGIGYTSTAATLTVPQMIYSVGAGWLDAAGNPGGGSPANPGTRMTAIDIGGNLGGSVDEQGSIYTWGSNAEGGLGVGNTTNPTTAGSRRPQRIYDASAVAFNADGQWTGGFGTWLNAPTLAGQTGRMTAISISNNSCYVVDHFGKGYSWGNTTNGQIGFSVTSNSAANGTPRQVYAPSEAGLGRFRANATTWQTGVGAQSGVTEEDQTRIIYIGGNYTHCFALAESGEVYAAGANGSGQLGVGSTTQLTIFNSVVNRNPIPPMVQVSAGRTHSLAVDSSGNLWAWGRQEYGKLGNGTVSTSGITSARLVDDSIGFAYVAASEDHSVGIDINGNLWTWGRNAGGRTGLGVTSGNTTALTQITDFRAADGNTMLAPGRFVKVDVAINATIALDEFGDIYTWGVGGNFHGVSGSTDFTRPRRLENFTGTRPVFADVASSAQSTSSRSVVVTDVDGNVWGWGTNDWGSLGLGNSTAVTTPIMLYEASTGTWLSTHAVESLPEHSTLNSYKTQLPAGTRMISVSIGYGSGGGMDENGSIYVWGYNAQREMGLGVTSGGYWPMKTVYNALTGEFTASQAANLAPGTRMVYFNIGSANGYIISEHGSMWAWGDNAGRAIGNGGGLTDVSYPTLIYNVSTGNFIGGAGRPPGTPLLMVHISYRHALALSADGRMFAVGTGGDGRLGTGNTSNRDTYIMLASNDDFPPGEVLYHPNAP